MAGIGVHDSGTGVHDQRNTQIATQIDDFEPETEAPSLGEVLSGKSVMVIDDEVTITDLIDDYLGRFGADVEFFHSGAEAFERLCAKSYDVVVCDQRMPGVNGQSLYRMVESVNPDLALRFIFVTGDVLNERRHGSSLNRRAPYISESRSDWKTCCALSKKS